jgi:hypothetical protein
MSVNPISYTWKWLWGKEPLQRTVVTPLDITEDVRFKAVLQELATVKGQLGRAFVEKRKEHEEKKEEKKEQEIIKDLNEQKKKINSERFGETISLGKMFLNYFRIDGAGKIVPKRIIEVTDKDDTEIFGQLGDIQISTKTGYMMITDKHSNVLAMSPFRGLIYKPESLGNQIRRGRITLLQDKDRNPIVDVENMMVGDVILDEDKKEWQETEELKKKVKDLLIEKENQIRDFQLKIERYEVAQVEQRRLIVQYEKTLRIYASKSQNLDSELSKVINQNIQMITQLGEIAKKTAHLSQQKALTEDLKDTTEEINKQLLGKYERAGSQTHAEEIKEQWFGDAERFKTLLPETINVQAPEEKPEKEMPQPGEVIGQRRDIKR